MSHHALPGAAQPQLLVPMRGRDPAAGHRPATPLELLFDLVFVVAVALAAERLHHALLEGDALGSVVSFTLVFFAIWWAWVNFTWFASAYDTDDVAYRLSVFVIMTGALVMAAGVPRIFDERDFTIAVLGYVIMRVALVTQWIRASWQDPPRRETARRFAIGVTACQVGWLGSLLLPPGTWPIAWLILVPAEMLVPYWGERAEATTWHPEHITERYGLFMIIVLGESVLAGSLAIQSVLDEGIGPGLATVVVGGLLIVYSTWWIYYDRPDERLLESASTAFIWSYLHLPIFASVAAVGAGLVVAIDEAAGHSHLGWQTVGSFIAIPVAIYLLSLWILYLRLRTTRVHRLVVPVAIVLVFASVLTPAPVLAVGLVLTGLVATKVALRIRGLADTPRVVDEVRRDGAEPRVGAG
jgi:low temperature requirement protein LtrA